MAYTDTLLVSKEPIPGRPETTTLKVRLQYTKGRGVFAFVSVEDDPGDGTMTFFPFASETLMVLRVARLGAKTLEAAKALLASEPVAGLLVAAKAKTLANNASYAAATGL